MTGPLTQLRTKTTKLIAMFEMGWSQKKLGCFIQQVSGQEESPHQGFLKRGRACKGRRPVRGPKVVVGGEEEEEEEGQATTQAGIIALMQNSDFVERHSAIATIGYALHW